MSSATRTWSSELSSIDTALLFAGIIDARQYFSTNDPLDVEVRTLADSIVHRANWEFFRNNGVGVRMGWKPGTGFNGFGTWVGYNEAMILYILAIGSPTHAIPPSSWFTWTSGYNWSTQYGYSYVIFPPLFGHQYSHCWIDFRSIRDIYMESRGISYFENSRRATYAAREYCIDNPGNFVGYGPNLWGLTASDGPNGYIAHGAPPPQNDDGTITPTAAASSIAFAPGVVIPALHHMYDAYGPQLFGIYGFKDAFNLTVNWWGPDFLGIDQGPIIIMIENYRTEAVWNRFMGYPDIQSGLERAGFDPVVGIPEEGTPEAPAIALLQSAPNPFRDRAKITYRLAGPGHTTLRLYDVLGRPVTTLVEESQAAGEHEVMLNGERLPNGVYWYQLQSSNESLERRCILIK
jgi:hypothetical protein